MDFQSIALPTELPDQKGYKYTKKVLNEYAQHPAQNSTVYCAKLLRVRYVVEHHGVAVGAVLQNVNTLSLETTHSPSSDIVDL